MACIYLNELNNKCKGREIIEIFVKGKVDVYDLCMVSDLLKPCVGVTETPERFWCRGVWN